MVVVRKSIGGLRARIQKFKIQISIYIQPSVYICDIISAIWELHIQNVYFPTISSVYMLQKYYYMECSILVHIAYCNIDH